MAQINRSRRIGRGFIEQLESRRLLATGALDTSFSGDGKAIINIPAFQRLQASDVAVQADGKTVVVGEFGKGDFTAPLQAAVARFNLNGSPDTTFGANGTGLVTFNIGNDNFDRLSAVAIQGDGKIVVVGQSFVDTVVSPGSRFGVARLNPNGRFDTTFDGDGKRTIDFHGYADDVIIQQVGTPNGIVQKIVVVGTNDDGTLFTSTANFAIARLNPNGSLDTTFSGDGKNQFGLGSDSEEARAVAIDSSGRLLLGGHSQSKFALIRVLGANGALDKSFGAGGQIITPLVNQNFSFIEDMVIDSGNRTIVAGRASIAGNQNFALARYNADGKRDVTFGGTSTGFVVTDFGGADGAFGITRSADGGLIVAGASSGKFALASYTADGMPRSSFGGSTTLITDFPAGSGTGGAVGIARGPGRRFVVAGGAPFKVARYLDTGANVVTAAAIDTGATEGATDTASLFVGRTERLPTVTRVFFNISGTAGFGSDYTLSGLTVPTTPDKSGVIPNPFVDIPANETFVIVKITAKDDTQAEGNEAAVFSIVPSVAYELGNPSSGKITLIDNDAGVTTNLSGLNDAYVRDGASADTNFGNATEIQVKASSTVGNNRLGYIKFDLSTIGATITSAKVNLFGMVSDTQNASVAVSLFPVADNSWTGAGITFNNKPAPGPNALASVNVAGTTQTLYSFDVTQHVKQEKALGHNLVSFQLRAPANSASFVTFVSGNAGSNQPKLSVLGSSDPVGIFSVNTTPASVKVGQSVKLAVKWEVPTGGWRQLTWVKLLLRDLDDPNSFVEFKFDEARNAFFPVSRPGVLTSPASLLVSQSSVQASGWRSPLVTTSFAFQFNAMAAGRRFAIDVSARNDAGSVSAYSPAGVINVKS